MNRHQNNSFTTKTEISVTATIGTNMVIRNVNEGKRVSENVIVHIAGVKDEEMEKHENDDNDLKEGISMVENNPDKTNDLNVKQTLTNTSIKAEKINSSEIKESKSSRTFSISTNISGENQNDIRNAEVRQQIRVKVLNCAKIIKGVQKEITYGQEYMKANPKTFETDEEIYTLAQNCSLLKSRGYILESLSQEEAEYHIAFSIIFHKDAVQVERLLRMLYRPQHFFCLHLDKHSSDSIHNAIYAIADCFDNVMIASKPVAIVYGGFTRLEAELNCMADALNSSIQWKYYINLAGEVFPLKTNAEMVKILKIYNGANDIEGLPAIPSRYTTSYIEKIPANNKTKPYIMNKNKKKDPPPHDIHIVKGSAYGIFSRQFVNFMLTNKISRDLLEWSHDTLTPDEHFWSTLHHLNINKHLNTPGGYIGKIMFSLCI